ncbi:NAD(P) transhydrogenase subunit alpha [Deinococcus cavernae]|uniref:proton-translocating NAD(P)(+) transhydrogenase n=1 Tax=Deinococcus cavernae TaxID=2320857 RepID=A0A418V6L9_9DEIO|nr:NAD(P) transhydrogenase subunit alpha [Deinococcus cavernae]RJF71726.1 NAD(P) transhydrogenase subunit alpha [Deinococcus cavernae]
MAVVIGVLGSPDPAERRTPMVPDVAKKLRAQGAEIVMQRGAGAGAYLSEADFPDVQWVNSADEVLARADMLWTLSPPENATLAQLKPGSVVVGLLQPYSSAERVQLLRDRNITAFAMELLPRISRAQSMDILSSQGAAAGYQCVLIAAAFCPKFFPMLTYAAGTIRPARVLVVGAGVAGLQAIATAKRLGAMVEGYDVRPETREQVESLGAKFVDTGVSAAGTGGYARELTDEEKAQQAVKLGKAVAQADVLITTAAVPGKRAPLIITADMVRGMKPGAVVVDMAAETGGNVAGTLPNQDVWVGPVRLIGPVNLPSNMPVHTSEMFSKNLYNFISPFIKDGVLALDDTDEVLTGATLTAGGEVRHPTVKQVLGL